MRYFLIALCVFVIAACSKGNQHNDLRAYIDEVKATPAGKIEGIPSYPPYESFIYSSASKRSPFDQPVDIQRRVFAKANANVKPDLNRPKQHLESFDLSSLTMVGTLAKGDSFWALVLDPSGQITKVLPGNYMGKNHGKIITLDDVKIELIEIVSNGLDGWVERPRLLALAKKG